VKKLNLIIIDAQNDFISGVLKCKNGEVAQKIANFVANFNKDYLNTFYSADFHPQNHSSFAEFGGIWPPHCVQNSRGSEICDELKMSKFPPNAENLFLKGVEAEFDEYSCFGAKNGENLALNLAVKSEKTLFFCGFVTEFCVKESIIEFAKNGFKCVILEDLCGFLSANGHQKTLEELETAQIAKISTSEKLKERYETL